jgi:hypothetical protein
VAAAAGEEVVMVVEVMVMGIGKTVRLKSMMTRPLRPSC